MTDSSSRPARGLVQRVHRLSVERPRLIFALVALSTVALGALIVRVQIDTDPENMLPANQPARVLHNKVKKRFALHDAIVVGVVNETDADGVFNPATLGRLHQLARAIERIEGVIGRDLLTPSTVDTISPAGKGTVRFEWLLTKKPKTRAEALAVRARALRMPMLRDTMISSDGKAVALIVPIKEKKESHRITEEIAAAAKKLGGDETYHFTGLPVAEDTFGYDMFVQMAVSAPLAALVIFIVMWWFFRSVALITSPMILAIVTVTVTMGLLIGLGFTVHIMSSMIPIFLMPIAVVDSVHILSEFSDSYHEGDDVREVVGDVMSALRKPMLYTSLTSAAGFASLAFTPIPPVQIFGAFVAFGIMLAYLLTITFMPAYIVSLSPARLSKMAKQHAKDSKRDTQGLLARVLRGTGRGTMRLSKPIVAVSLLLLGISGWGISRIQINDNPVRWFQPSHPIRVADRVLNKHFSGTYPAFLVLDAGDGRDVLAALDRGIEKALVDSKSKGSDLSAAWKAIVAKAPQKPVTQRLSALIDGIEANIEKLEDKDEDSPAIARWKTLRGHVERAQKKHAVFRDPALLAYVEKIERELTKSPLVGKTSSLIDIIKTVQRDLYEGDPKRYAIPKSSQAVAQTLLSFQSSHKPHMLWHFVTPSYRSASVWLQLKSGDNKDMLAVVKRADAFLKANPPPPGIKVNWAGLTYLNVVWQDRMVSGMINSLLSAFAVVFVMMVVLFRSLRYGLLAMVPLTFTIGLIYGLIGLIGKDYDMPVAVLSSLTLGLSVDFAIHFLERARSLHRQHGNFADTLREMFEEPGRAIGRNAIVIAIGFLPLLAAPLVPYNTVGLLMAAIMAVSSVVTVVLLPALLGTVARGLFPNVDPAGVEAAKKEDSP